MRGDRVLVVLDDSFDDPDLHLPRWAKRALLGAGSVHLLAPYVGSRVSVATDDDAPRRLASKRLERVTRFVQSIGIRPSSSVSDYSPFDAVTTYLSETEVDRIVVVLTAEGNWREKGLLERLGSLASASVEGMPVTDHLIRRAEKQSLD